MKTSPNAILEIGQSNVIVYSFLALWKRGELSWEQALQGMVVLLVNQNRRLIDEALDAESKRADPLVFSTTLTKAEAKRLILGSSQTPKAQ